MKYLKPALIAACASLFLSVFPLTFFANYFLGLWIWGAGILAVFLYVREHKNTLSFSDSLHIGVATGFIAGVVASLLALVLLPVLSPEHYARELPNGLSGFESVLFIMIITAGYVFVSLVGSTIGFVLFKDSRYLGEYSVKTDYLSALGKKSVSKTTKKKKSVKKKKTAKKKR